MQILWWNFLFQSRFLLQIKDNPNYITKVNQPAHADSVKIGSPIFHYVDLRGINGYLQVSVKSNDDSVCGIISVHPLKCPLTDITTEDNMNDDEVKDVIAISNNTKLFCVFPYMPSWRLASSHASGSERRDNGFIWFRTTLISGSV